MWSLATSIILSWCMALHISERHFFLLANQSILSGCIFNAIFFFSQSLIVIISFRIGAALKYMLTCFSFYYCNIDSAHGIKLEKQSKIECPFMHPHFCSPMGLSSTSIGPRMELSSSVDQIPSGVVSGNVHSTHKGSSL